MMQKLTSATRVFLRYVPRAFSAGIALLFWVLCAPAVQGQSFSSVHTFSGWYALSTGQFPQAALVRARNGNFYGLAASGGTYNAGTIYQITPGGTFTVLHNFHNVDGASPRSGLIQASDGNLYGTVAQGGANGGGAVFKITTTGTFTTLYSFTKGLDGSGPAAALLQASDGNLYGTTTGGGANGSGTIFEITTGGTLTTLHSFNYSTDGYYAYALMQARDGNLYGTTGYGSANHAGSVFRITTGGLFTLLYSFTKATDGYSANGVVQANDGNLYGTTQAGGTSGHGTVFRVTTGGNFTNLHNFSGSSSDGSQPNATLLQGSDGNLYGTTVYGGANNKGTIFQMSLGGSFATLYSFSGSDGSYPYGALIQTKDGSLYGTANSIFKVTTAGALTTLYLFQNGADGANPHAPFLLGSDGNLYGTSVYGGPTGNGNVFKIAKNGKVTTLYNFTGEGDEANPYAGVIQASDGNLYGSTNPDDGRAGTLFKLGTDGTFATLYSFTGGADGYYASALVQGNDGALYGTTQYGGVAGNGNVFKITTDGTFTNLYSFTGGADGNAPSSALIQATDGNLYGTTPGGGTAGYGNVFKIGTDGTFTNLYSFTGGSDGQYPVAALVQASDGNLYGTTTAGGTNNFGAIFRIGMDGTFTPLYSFTGGLDGNDPVASLVQASDGNLYGTTHSGGANGDGTIFQVTTAGILTPVYSFTGGTDGSNPVAALTQTGNGVLYGNAYGGGEFYFGTAYKLALPANPVPTVSSVSPNQAAAGSPDTTVVLTGTNFVLGSTAMWGTVTRTSLQTTYLSSTQLRVVIPANLLSTAGTLYISVGNPGPGGGYSRRVVYFDVTNPLPVLTAVTPNTIVQGSSDSLLTLTGSSFYPLASVRFGTVNLAATVVSSTQMTVTVPSALLSRIGTTTVSAVNHGPGGGASTTLPFTITPAPTTVALVSSPAPTVTTVNKALVVSATLQNAGNFGALNVQITSATLNTVGSLSIVPANAINISQGGVAHLRLTFPVSAAASGTNPTLTLNYTSTNAGSGVLTVTCGTVH